MNLSEALHHIAQSDPKKSSSLCSRLADQFEDDLLDFADFPSDHFDFIKDLFSDPKYFNKPGIWNFVLAINNTKDALKHEQLHLIEEVFLNNYEFYLDADLCLAICDFIARNVKQPHAHKLLQQLKETESKKPLNLQGYANEGFFILEQEDKRNKQY